MLKKLEEIIVSAIVLQLNVINKSDSPKKKKNSQKKNKKYDVDLEVMEVNKTLVIDTFALK